MTAGLAMGCIRHNIAIMDGVILGCCGGCADLDDGRDALPRSAAVHIWVPIERGRLLIICHSYCLAYMHTSEVVHVLMDVDMDMAVASIAVPHVAIDHIHALLSLALAAETAHNNNDHDY